ncbi:MAG: hypothetical protein IT564_02150, partial [Rhodospirillales bacterium]|nr:hypothetical protein [Rhodospirillales bacterium]
MTPDNRNMILAVVLSILIVVGFEFYFGKIRPPAPAPAGAPAAGAPAPAAPAPGV